MKITLLTIGKIKEKYYRDAISEYEKRLSRYCKLEIREFPDEKTSEAAGDRENEQTRDKEAVPVLKYLDEQKGFVITLEIQGNMYDSVEFSEKMSKLMSSGESHIIFVIGGSLGLSEQIIKKADLHLSFSNMTFPHQLMRVILLEQIYRGFRIMNHEPYHK